MSRSKISSNESSSAEARDAHQRLSQMMRQGRSFSGRERNCCFLNVGDNRFATVSAVTGFDLPDDGRALATVDWDNDGDLDVFTTNRNAPRLRFLQNNGPTGADHNFLTLHLIGDGKSSNVDAIGARVEVTVGDGEKQNTLIRTVRAGEGFLTHNGHGLHIGLGSAMKIEKATISWPAAEVETLTDLEAGRHYQIIQGEAPRRITSPPVALPSKSPIADTPVDENVRIPFVRQLPALELAVETLGGQPTTISAKQKSLLILWSTTCRPCLDELQTLKKRASELESLGLNVIPVCTDAIDRTTNRAPIKSRIDALGLPFESYFATDPLINNLQSAQIYLLAMERAPTVPTSYLLTNGRLTHMYRGEVDVDQVLADASATPASPLERLKASAFLPGRMVDSDDVRETATTSYVWELMDIARKLEEQRVWKPAIALYREATELLPDNELARFKMGVALEKSGRKKEAALAFTDAVRLNPEFVPAINNLAALHLENRNAAAALPLFQKITQLQPDFVDAHYNLGLLYRSKNDLTGAYRELAKAHELAPQDEKICCDLGALVAMRGQTSQARSLFEQALKIKPGDAQALMGLGNLAAMSGDRAKAEQLMMQAFKNASDNPALANHIRKRLMQLKSK